jgi:hypothetical protein
MEPWSALAVALVAATAGWLTLQPQRQRHPQVAPAVSDGLPPIGLQREPSRLWRLGRQGVPRTSEVRPDAHGGLSFDDFRAALERRFADAEQKGRWHLDVSSGDLYRELGEHPRRDGGDAMALCCEAMLAACRSGDRTISSDPLVRGRQKISPLPVTSAECLCGPSAKIPIVGDALLEGNGPLTIRYRLPRA